MERIVGKPHNAPVAGYFTAKSNQQISSDVRWLGDPLSAVPEINKYFLNTVFDEGFVFHKLEAIIQQGFEMEMHQLPQSLVIAFHQLLPEPGIPGLRGISTASHA